MKLAAAVFAALALLAGVSAAQGVGPQQFPRPVNPNSCETCISAKGCPDQFSACALNCQTRFQEGVSLNVVNDVEACLGGCNRKVDVCVGVAQQECVSRRECFAFGP